MSAVPPLDPARLTAIAERHAPSFRSATPFPHVVVDDFVPPEILDTVLAEFPAPHEGGWIRFDSEQERKLASVDDTLMGPTARALLAELNGAATLDFLVALTGIDGLVPDPWFFGGGLHQIEPGGHLEVHADFNLHPRTGLYRRLNLLLYLNHGWDPDWGGALELWNADLSERCVSVDPVFNRCVVFATTDRSFHGHPEPLRCPTGVTRKSLALYYYARDPDPDDASSGEHNTLFRGRPDPAAPPDRSGSLRQLVRELTPPLVARGVRALRRRQDVSA
jgi:hypothetical protein